ncbi:hypothetical protein JCM19231_2761 [Vibrio ishigakensis]|uniref:Lipoprotein LPP20-like domain-containing protein n=1 Tax=Vibrio ishigakensis TaxID=1481914 RepID=A0A0B8P636_9VIBR|nr:hypothetical protein JCM19231_2761 [Vibrio ishigakensis]
MLWGRGSRIALVVAACGTMLLGCQSTKPNWYSNPQTNDSQYIYAVAQARTLSHAKKIAVNNINESLWTQVDSSSYIRETLRETNNKGSFNSLVDNKINTRTESLTLNGVEFMQLEENDLGAFVQVRVKKSLVAQQLKKELEEIDFKARTELNNLKSQDKLVWWLDNRSAFQLKHNASVRTSMLVPLDGTYKFVTTSLESYIDAYEKTGNNLYIRLSSDVQSKQSLQFLGEQLSEFNIATSMSKRHEQTHIVYVSSERRRNKVADAYISTLVSKIIISNTKNQVISRSEIISTGNSVTSYKYADEGLLATLMSK